MSDIDEIGRSLMAQVEAAQDLDELEAARITALGKNGVITNLLKGLGKLQPQERLKVAPEYQRWRGAISESLAARKSIFENAALDAQLAGERLDMSLPAPPRHDGSVHPVSQVMDELAEIFADLGFAVATGPEIEDDWHNFTALNIPETHPARAMHDTFYFDREDKDGHKMLLRTHTSPVQIRTMVAEGAPVRIIAPGRTYRSDSDATHTPMFHQVEGLVIDRGIHMGHLKWTLETFLKAFFETDDIYLRLRPSYFPFTEPSAEVDVWYRLDKGRRILGGSPADGNPGGWMELLGSGMVHPRVIEAAGLDPAEYQGFAFGCGIDRLAMLKYGIDDLRAFFDGDLRWLKHYGFAALDVPTLSGGDFGMKFTYGWLKEHLDTDLDAAGIAERLTAIGLEVEGIENPGEKLADFRVAEVVEAGPHPNADKLQLLSVDAGTGERWQVVCGAPNARAGMKGVFAPPGTYVPGAGFTLKPAKIRDVESFGMMCSTRELELGDEHDGIIELDADAPVGMAFPDYAGLNDPVIDVSVTPNRQDCMGVRGIARDLAAAGAGMLKPLADAYAPAGVRARADGAAGEVAPIDGDGPGPDVRTDDPDGCPAFYARSVSGVTNKEAPEWMRRRLVAIGQKPISALVDITNFIMIDLGRPLHVYDAAKLSGGLVARRAQPGEEVLALNGKTYRLDDRMTVIADDAHVHDIGGIMGGEESGVSESTTDIVIECAYFTPEAIAVTGQALALTSDARARFERGVDPAFLDDGLTIATQLVMAICGGTPSEATRAGSPPVEARTIVFDPAHTLSLAGIDVPAPRQADILRSLGFGVEGTEKLTISVPSWRRDVSGSADLVEEVVRIVGLDAVPSTPLPRVPGVAKPTATKLQLLERRARRAAAAFGLDEAVNWSFISETEAAPFGGGDWVLANPISEELKVMRPSLLPGLLAAAQRNSARGADSVRSFELGRRYFTGKDGASAERLTLGLLLAGERAPRDWQAGKAGPSSPYDAKAAVEAILTAVGAPVGNLQVMPVEDAQGIWHPGQSATLRLGPKTVLAEFGSLHPRLVKAFGLTGGVVAAQIFLDAIPQGRASTPMRGAFAPSALQVVRRDFAFLVDDGVASADLVRAVRGADKANIVDARLFDRFAGDGVPDGKVSLAVEVTLQPGDKSFTDDEIKAISDKVVAAAGKLGAELRA